MAIIEGAVSGNLMEVDAEKRGLINTPTTASYAGYVSMLAEHDSGTVTGTKSIKQLDISDDYRLRTGLDTLLFNEWFSGSSLNTNLWNSTDNLSSASISGGFLTLNASGSAGAAMQSRVQSYKTFPVYGTFGLYGEFLVQFPYDPVSNNVCEIGFGNATGSAAPSEGSFFRLNNAGELRCVVSYNGSEDQSDSLNFTNLIGANHTVHLIVNTVEDGVEFWIDDVLVSRRDRQTAAPSVVTTGNFPILMRTYNTAITTQAQQIKVSMVNVTMSDMSMGKPWNHVMAGMGGHCSQGQTGGIMGSTGSFVNAGFNGVGAVMTNTTAALGSGLGGQFVAKFDTTFLSGSSSIDGILCSYQVPVGTVVRPGKGLYINGIDVYACVAGSAVSASIVGGPLLLAFQVAYGHTAVSLATTETATSKAPRRIALGMMNIPANTGTGYVATPINREWNTPIFVNPGEFIAIVCKNLSMALTTGGTVFFYVAFDGYWQ